MTYGLRSSFQTTLFPRLWHRGQCRRGIMSKMLSRSDSWNAHLLNILLSLRKSRRKAKGCDERWSLEDRHLGDLPGRCVEGDYLNPKGLICALSLVGSIEGKGRLCIGGSRIQAPPATHPGPKWGDGDNGANRFSALIPRGAIGDIQHRVFFQGGHNPVAIDCLLR